MYESVVRPGPPVPFAQLLPTGPSMSCRRVIVTVAPRNLGTALRGLVAALSLMACVKTLLADEIRIQVSGIDLPQDYFTREHLREVFFVRVTSWPNGLPIRVFVLPDQNPLHIRFSKEILGVYPYQLRSAWDRMIYSGTGVPPTVVDSEEEMRARLKSTPGAIGYEEKR